MHLFSTQNSEIISSKNANSAVLVASNLSSYFRNILLVTESDESAERFAKLLQFIKPNLLSTILPAYDCLPYDRASPSEDILSKRITCFYQLTHNKPNIVITSANSLLQRTIPKQDLVSSVIGLNIGDILSRDDLIHQLVALGFMRSSSANEVGEFAVRGDIVDIMLHNEEKGIRVDFFGNKLDQLRYFDPATQISVGKIDNVTILPASEVILNSTTLGFFKRNYANEFGVHALTDPFAEAILEGRKYGGMENWLSLFYEKLDTIFDYFTPDLIIYDNFIEQSLNKQLETISEYYLARKAYDAKESGFYRPVKSESLWLDVTEIKRKTNNITTKAISFFDEISGTKTTDNFDAVPSLLANGKARGLTPLQELVAFYEQNHKSKNIIIACYSEGSLSRISSMLQAHDIITSRTALPPKDVTGQVYLTILGMETGFAYGNFILFSEEDIFGEKLARIAKRSKRADKFLLEQSSLVPGELVVHKDHGIGRYEGLRTMVIENMTHDLLEISYDAGDKLFVPVENINLITLYGPSNLLKLDRLGTVSWQERKAKLKNRIKLAAEHLLKLAAKRKLSQAPVLYTDSGMYDEFCARFPYNETEDQLSAIEDVSRDLNSGMPSDRLICGDVGFGKTEVAIRAAYMAAGQNLNRKAIGQPPAQVAVLVPTTLLARQHYKNFTERFADTNLRVACMSRMVARKDIAEIKQGTKSGDIDIVIGTHNLLSKDVAFANLVLAIIDEEQHFGVKQKEKIKEFADNVHLLTLSATPIPRTMQIAMSGIRELSLITTPPIDRQAVKTFVIPFDALIVREALLREHMRGGKSFIVCPKISDLNNLEEEIKRTIPELRTHIAHGQMAPGELDQIMNDYYDGKFEVLISTSIVESGLDVPGANTIIIHKADQFGLAALYQLRGRVGRGKLKAYAYLTVSSAKPPTKNALKRLEVIHKLDALGAGFTIATHDMDIRGFGNLLGEEQSGHIKEVGVELYQNMLEEAVLELKADATNSKVAKDFSPVINLGISVLIPENYVSDIDLRLGLYRRASSLETLEEVESFALELVDRFGPLPEEVANLLEIIKLKQLCKKLNIEKIDTGPKGFVLTFFENYFANPEKLLDYITKNPFKTKLNVNQKLVFFAEITSSAQKLKMAGKLLGDLVAMVG